MGLADEIQASHQDLYRRSHTALCRMGQVLGYLGDEDREALERLMADRRVYGVSIADLLNGWAPKLDAAASEMKAGTQERSEAEHLAGLCGTIAGGSVQRHRNGKCMCGRED